MSSVFLLGIPSCAASKKIKSRCSRLCVGCVLLKQKGLVSKEIVLPCRWGSERPKYGMKETLAFRTFALSSERILGFYSRDEWAILLN